MAVPFHPGNGSQKKPVRLALLFLKNISRQNLLSKADNLCIKNEQINVRHITTLLEISHLLVRHLLGT